MTPRQRLTTLILSIAVPLAATACGATVDPTADPTTASAVRKSATTARPAVPTESRSEDAGSTSTADSTTAVNTEPNAGADGVAPGAASTSPASRSDLTPTPTGVRLVCPDGTVHTYPSRPDDATIVTDCRLDTAPEVPNTTVARPPTPTAPPPTSAPPPHITGVTFHAVDGLPDPSGATGWLCVIPPGPEWPRLFPDTSWCPTDLATRSRQFSFRATFTDGSEVSGVTPWITPGTHWSVSPGPGDGTIRIDVHSDGAISTGWGWG